jgi:putative transposase
MPRSLRRCPGGIVYHALNRAVARITLFRRDADYLAFERTLADAHARLPVELFAYCVMPNHWHLVLRPRRDGDLSAFMQWLTLAHAQRWRTSHNTVGYGPLYQGRFKAFAIEEDAHLLTVLRYVERNPRRANLVDAAQDWRWSSLHRRLNGTDAERALLANWPVDRPGDWTARVNRPQTAAEDQALSESIRRSRPYGSPAWQERTARELKLHSCFRAPGRPRKPNK